jgi:hypothetical protein
MELDQIKLRAMRGARGPVHGRRSSFMKSRIATLLTIAALTVGVGGTFAIASGGGDDNGSAAKSQYKPGKGCGDQNHEHARNDECKSK